MEETNIIEYEFAVAAIQEFDVANTETSKKSDEIEDELAIIIHNKMLLLMSEHNKKGLQIQDLQQKYGNDVEGTIRVAITDAYMEGARYSGKVAGQENIFPTGTNIDKIQELTQNSVSFFWRQLDFQIKSEEAKTHAKEMLTPEQFVSFRHSNPLLTWYGVMPASQLIANDAIPVSVAFGTNDKFLELKSANPILNTKQWKIVFVARLNELKTCLICRALDYRNSHVEYEVGSPYIIYPVYGTHKRCRCRLMIKDGKKLYKLF